MNYYFTQKKNVYDIFTQHLFNYKINKIEIFAFNSTTVFYTIGKYLNYPQLFFSNKIDMRREVGFMRTSHFFAHGNAIILHGTVYRYCTLKT